MGVSPGQKNSSHNNEVTIGRVSTVIEERNEQDGVPTCQDTNDNNEPKTRKISEGKPVITTIIVYSSCLSVVTLSSAG